MNRKTALCVFVLISVQAVFCFAEAEKTVAVVPFENFTDDKDALAFVTPLVIDRIRETGLTVVNVQDLDDYLCEERVRSSGSVTSELAGKLYKKFGASMVLTGAVLSFSEGDNPRIGVLARLIDSFSGKILWADFTAASGEDFTSILGLGRVETLAELVPVALDRMFATLDPGTLDRRVNATYAVAVMPFRNNSEFRYAGRIAMYMFIAELLKGEEFVPVEYGNVRESIVDLRIMEKGELSHGNITALTGSLNASGVLVGAVDGYRKERENSSPPVASMSARLIDGRTNKVLWYDSAVLSGEDRVKVLDWGRMRSVHTVAYNVVSDLTQKMESGAN